MLQNTIHKLFLFYHIQFHVLFLSITQHNLKFNAVAATSQNFCTPQRKSRVIMDRRNMSRSEQRPQKNHRYIRSTSIPSGSICWAHSAGPQRTRSQIVFNGHADNNFMVPNPVFNYLGNYVVPGLQNELVPAAQQPWNNFQQPVLPAQFNRFCPGNNRSVCNIPVRAQHQRRREEVLQRKWEPVKSVDKKQQKFVFTLMSYNILAQDLVDNHYYLYQRHEDKTLEWDVRWINILKEIGDVDPDIICLQEVQQSHIKGYFDVLEKKLGYKSLYKKRTGVRTDGCAIYYKSKRLDLVDSVKVEYFQQNVPILNRDNVGIVAKFIPKEISAQPFIVATTHLLYNPKRQDVRLAQIQNLITEIDKMSFSGINQDGTSSYLPIILTGDLNSTPDSVVYEFITRGQLKYENLNKRSLARSLSKETNGKVLVPESLQITDNCQYAQLAEMRNELIKDRLDENKADFDKIAQNVQFSTGTLTHSFNFKSVYKHFIRGDVEGTTYQDEWITVDYIFYSGRRHRGFVEDKLKLISKIQLLTKNQLTDNYTIPNWKLGSDHFSLAAKFSLE